MFRAFDDVIYYQPVGEVNLLVGAQARRGEKLVVGGTVYGIGMWAVIEANDVFFINFAHGAYINPLIVHGYFSRSGTTGRCQPEVASGWGRAAVAGAEACDTWRLMK